MLRFLGTGAGEGTPDPFCSCRVCENARKVGGKEIRTRSGFIADDVIVDLGSDFVAQCAHQRISLVDYEHLLISHTHGDHMNHTLFWERFVARRSSGKVLNVYLSEAAMRYFDEQFPVVGDKAYLRDFNLVPLTYGVSHRIGSWNVTPLRGRHGTKFEPTSTNYLMEKPGMKLHYALDSGYFFDDTFDALKGAKLDVLIMECTNPILDRSVSGKRDGHMDYFTAMDTLAELYRLGAITASTQVYFTHISPNETTHAELAAHLAALDTPYRITAAWDGMEI